MANKKRNDRPENRVQEGRDWGTLKEPGDKTQDYSHYSSRNILPIVIHPALLHFLPAYPLQLALNGQITLLYVQCVSLVPSRRDH